MTNMWHSHTHTVCNHILQPFKAKNFVLNEYLYSSSFTGPSSLFHICTKTILYCFLSSKKSKKSKLENSGGRG